MVEGKEHLQMVIMYARCQTCTQSPRSISRGCSHCFRSQSAYVALSRVRTLEGVALLGLVSEKVKDSESAGLELERLTSNVCVTAPVNAREE